MTHGANKNAEVNAKARICIAFRPKKKITILNKDIDN